jgi:ribosome biogenesis protein Tsr3
MRNRKWFLAERKLSAANQRVLPHLLAANQINPATEKRKASAEEYEA